MSHTKKSNKYNVRAVAAQVLFDILEQGKSARDCLPQAQAKVAERDRSWLQEMIYGVLRDLPLLQYWLRQLLNQPLKQRNKILEHVLMLGFYQLVFSRVSSHAAVSESVQACQSLNQEPMKGLVNAVLRNFIRQDQANHKPDNKQIRSGLPKWLYRSLIQYYPEQFDELCQNMRKRPPMWLRVNANKTSVTEYAKLLSEQQIQFELSALHPQAIVLPNPHEVTSLPGYQEGWFAIQDGAAQFAAALLDPQPEERVLDCCAAPGGKTSHLIERQPQLSECVAIDNDAARLARVKDNLARLGHQATLLEGDATAPQKWWDGQQFDRILLDAPCSATGVIRKHPDIRWLRKGQDIEVLQQLQAEILDTVWPMLKPGGILLYATCSILPQENAEQIEAFVNRTPNASLTPIAQNPDKQAIGWQILPGQQQMDGFYYARLLKSQEIIG